jgi:uncharacterized membrane protein YqiK
MSSAPRQSNCRSRSLNLQMLGRRNLAYGVIALALFLTISLMSSTIPQEFLADIQDYRPLQEQGIDLLLSLAQLGLLPAAAFLLDHKWVDARIAMQKAEVAQNAAQVQQAQASLTFAQQQATRYGTLARDGWGTVQNAQQWASQQRQDKAGLKSAQHARKVTVRQLAALKAQRNSAEGSSKRRLPSAIRPNSTCHTPRFARRWTA